MLLVRGLRRRTSEEHQQQDEQLLMMDPQKGHQGHQLHFPSTIGPGIEATLGQLYIGLENSIRSVLVELFWCWIVSRIFRFSLARWVAWLGNRESGIQYYFFFRAPTQRLSTHVGEPHLLVFLPKMTPTVSWRHLRWKGISSKDFTSLSLLHKFLILSCKEIIEIMASEEPLTPVELAINGVKVREQSSSKTNVTRNGKTDRLGDQIRGGHVKT